MDRVPRLPRRRAAVASLALGICLVASAFGANPAVAAKPPTILNTQVNQVLSGPFVRNKQAEPAIAENPLNLLNVIVGANDAIADPPCTDTYPSVCAFPSGISVTGVYASFDGGQTFACRGLIDLSPYGEWSEGDPFTTFDSRGNAYLSTLAFLSTSEPGQLADVFVAKSTDGGCSWPQAVKASGPTHASYDDHPSIAADANPASPFRDYVYAAWTKFNQNFSNIQIVFSRSTDGGLTWDNTQAISPATFSQGGRTGAIVRVAPNGTVYVVWADVVQRDPRIRVSISYDGGKTFPKQNLTVASIGGENPFDESLPGSTFFGTSGLPSFDVGKNGTLYVAWGRRTAGHTVTMLARSTTAGLSWETPVVAADVAGRSDVFQAVTPDPNGNDYVVSVAVDDRPAGTLPGAGVVSYDAYWARSTNAGISFSAPSKLSTLPSDPDVSSSNGLGSQFIGDYITAVADATHLYAVWTDGRNGSTCAARDAYVLGAGPKPNVIQQCPVTFGNTDIYLGTVTFG
jgi:hypothetical protein